MPHPIRSAERDALAPLLEIARRQHPAARAAWLTDLRRDAPVVVARLEQLLAEGPPAGGTAAAPVTGVSPARAHTAGGFAPLRDRVRGWVAGWWPAGVLRRVRSRVPRGVTPGVARGAPQGAPRGAPHGVGR